jgi:hypothetical protein
MNVDPAASMRIWEMEIDLGGRTFDVPALPASGWFPVLLEGNPLLVLDMIEDESLDDMLLSGQVPPDELVEILLVTIEQAAGREFHAAFVLAQVAAVQWAAISGVLTERGFRWDQAPLGAALDAIYAIVVKGLDKEALARFQSLLDTPTGALARRRAGRRDQAVEDFASVAGPKPEGGVRATSERSGSARPKTRPRLPPRPLDAPLRAPRKRP